MDARIALCFLICAAFGVSADVDIITEPRPGEEYVIVSSGQHSPLKNFESAHKIPEKHPHHRYIKPEDVNERLYKKSHNGKSKHPTEGIVSIEEDKKTVYKKAQKVKESIEIDIPVSKIEDIKIKEKVHDVDINPKLAVLEAMSESGKLIYNEGTTTQKPVLTTSAPSSTKGYDYIPINFDTIDDINSGLLSSNVKLETAGSEQKQHSRIQIKKGPNGQDYEYEYIYYYYDEEEEAAKKDASDRSTTTETTSSTFSNAHDGPSKTEIENQISKEIKSRNKYSTIDRSPTTTTTIAPTPEVQNEVIQPTIRSRTRGRNIVSAPVEEEVEAERLPSSTRFPPRGRNIAATSSTTSAPEATSEVVRQRGRAQVDNVADESIGQTRSRTRAHVRRPSSELVDLDSFKTNSGERAQYKEPPTRYSAESKTTTEAAEPAYQTNDFPAKEVQKETSFLSGIKFEEVDDSKLPADYKQTTTYEQDTTEYTTMTAMEKVALDLYAYLAGENLNNEITSDAAPLDASTSTDEAWTTEDVSTTEEQTTPTTTTTTTTTSTTTTTTTTPAPTTTTTTSAPTRPSRFRSRPGARSRAPAATSAATEAPQETSTRARGRFGSKPNAGRKITAAAVEASTSAAPAEKPSTQPKAFGGSRRGLFSARTRPSSTTAAPAQEASSAASEAPVPRPRLRPGLRRAPSSTTTAAPSSAEIADVTAPTGSGSTGSGEVIETTVAPVRTIGRKPGQRPASLRPGPRLNLRPVGRRPSVSSAAPESASEAPVESAPAEVSVAADEAENAATPAPEAPRGGLKLRNRLQVSPSPRPRTAGTAAPRRPNPLLKNRGRSTTEATTEAPKKVTEAQEESDSGSAEKSETEAETEAAAVETTPAPPLRGLDALIARRRAAGVGARPVRPARRA